MPPGRHHHSPSKYELSTVEKYFLNLPADEKAMLVIKGHCSECFCPPEDNGDKMHFAYCKMGRWHKQPGPIALGRGANGLVMADIIDPVAIYFLELPESEKALRN